MDKYCNMKKLYKEPKGKYNIFTVVFFLTSSAYKNSYEYFEGLKDNLQKFYYQFDNSFYFRLYYDKSLTEKIHNNEDLNKMTELLKKYLEEIKNSPRVQLVEYECPNFKNGQYHKGMFGTLLRFAPIFSQNNVGTVAMSDIERLAIYDVKIVYEYTKYYNADIGWRTGIHNEDQKDGRIIHDDWIFAGNFVCNVKFNHKILDQFFKDINDDNSKLNKYILSISSWQKDHPEKIHDKLLKEENKFIYGIDEALLNFYLKPNIETNNNSILILPLSRLTKILSNHYRLNNKYNSLTEPENNNVNQFFKLLFPDLIQYTDNALDNFRKINKKIFPVKYYVYRNFELNLQKNYQKIIDNKNDFLVNDTVEHYLKVAFNKSHKKKLIKKYKFTHEKWH